MKLSELVTEKEIEECKKIAVEVTKDLTKRKGITYGKMFVIGIMITKAMEKAMDIEITQDAV